MQNKYTQKKLSHEIVCKSLFKSAVKDIFTASSNLLQFCIAIPLAAA